MNKSNMGNPQNLKDDYYVKNVFGISSAEFIWGLGLPVVIESTFLQLFIKSLGASSFVIGLIPTFFFIGSSIFALFASYLTSTLEFKRIAVVLLHLVSGLSLFFFGLFLYIFGDVDHLLVVFFISYGIFSLSLGMAMPVWLNYLVVIFSDKKSIPGIAFMLIAQNFAKLIGSMAIVKIVDQYSFSVESSAMIFVGVGVLFSFGSFFFLFTKEVPEKGLARTASHCSFFSHTLSTFRHLIRNRNFLFFLAGDFEFYILVTVISFYANYATTFCGVDPAVASGIFVACIYCGAICANFFLGSLGWLDLKSKYKFSKIVSCTAFLLLVVFQFQWIFFIASFFFGLSRGCRMVSMAPAIKKLSGLVDSTSYFAISPLITLPFASALPMLAGKFLDRFSYLDGDSYRIVFAFCAFLIVVTFFFIQKTDFSVNE